MFKTMYEYMVVVGMYERIGLHCHTQMRKMVLA